MIQQPFVDLSVKFHLIAQSGFDQAQIGHDQLIFITYRDKALVAVAHILRKT